MWRLTMANTSVEKEEEVRMVAQGGRKGAATTKYIPDLGGGNLIKPDS